MGQPSMPSSCMASVWGHYERNGAQRFSARGRADRWSLFIKQQTCLQGEPLLDHAQGQAHAGGRVISAHQIAILVFELSTIIGTGLWAYNFNRSVMLWLLTVGPSGLTAATSVPSPRYTTRPPCPRSPAACPALFGQCRVRPERSAGQPSCQRWQARPRAPRPDFP